MKNRSEIVGTEEYLMGVAMGRISVNGNTYYKVEELWWASSKPPAVKTWTKVWRDKGYYAQSRYVEVKSGTSWNNSPNDMKLYSIYAAYKGNRGA